MDRKTTIGLVVVFALLGLYVLLVQKPQEQVNTNATATAEAGKNKVLWDFPLDQVISVHLDDLTQVRAVAFQKDTAGQWTVTQPSEGRGDVVLAERIIASLRRLYVLSEIPNVTDLVSFGLDHPLYRVRVGLADGSTYELTVGAKTLTGSGYYVIPAGESKARVITTTGINDAVITTFDAPPYFVPTAVPTQVGEATVDLSKILPPTSTPELPATATPTATP